MLLHHPSNQRAIETALGTKLMDKEDHIRERTVVVIGETKLQRETAVSDILLMQVRPTRAAHRTIIQHDGPNHLGLWLNAIPEHQIVVTWASSPCIKYGLSSHTMARITSAVGTAQGSPV